MTKTWDKMTPRERDALVAEKAMGWIQKHPDLWERPGDQWPAYTGVRVIRTPCMPFHPTIDYNACRLVEDEIERRGKQVQADYVFALAELCFSEVPTWGAEHIARMMHVPPDQKCRAALRAMGTEI